MTVEKYEQLYAEMQEIIGELERCRECIQNVEWEFRGDHPNYGAREGRMGLHHMNAVLAQNRNYGFWKGQSAEAFENKLRELYQEVEGAKDDMIAGLRTVEKNLEKKYDRKQKEVSAALEELNAGQQTWKAGKDFGADVAENIRNLFK